MDRQYWQNIFDALSITYKDGKYEYQGAEVDAQDCCIPEPLVNDNGESMPLSVQSAIAAHQDALNEASKQ